MESLSRELFYLREVATWNPKRRIQEITRVNAIIVGLMNYYSMCDQISVVIRKYAWLLKYTAYKSLKKFGGEWVVLIRHHYVNYSNKALMRLIPENVIDVTKYSVAGLSMTDLGFGDEISVDLKSTTEVNAGLKAFYQMDDKWSFGASFAYKHHADNGVEGLASELGDVSASAMPAAAVAGLVMGGKAPNAAAAMAMLPMMSAEQIAGAATGLQQGVLNTLLDKVADMDDGFDEYVLGLSAAYQMTETTQVAVYGEYTFDTAHDQSQNGTDVKAELGVRLNVQF